MIPQADTKTTEQAGSEETSTLKRKFGIEVGSACEGVDTKQPTDKAHDDGRDRIKRRKLKMGVPTNGSTGNDLQTRHMVRMGTESKEKGQMI